MEEGQNPSVDPMIEALAATKLLRQGVEELGPAMRALGGLSLQEIDASQVRILNARLNAIGAAVVGASQTTESIIDMLPFRSPLHVLGSYAQERRRFTSRELFEYFEELDRRQPGIMPKTQDFPALFATLRQQYAEAMAAAGTPLQWYRTKALTNPKHWFEFVGGEAEPAEDEDDEPASGDAALPEVEPQDSDPLADSESQSGDEASAIDELSSDAVIPATAGLPHAPGADALNAAPDAEESQPDEQLLAYAEEVLREIVVGEPAASFTVEHIEAALGEHCYLEPEAAAQLLQTLVRRGVLTKHKTDDGLHLELAPAVNRPIDAAPAAEASEFLDQGFDEEDLPLVDAILDYLAHNLRFLKDRIPRRTLVTLMQERLPVSDREVTTVLDRFVARGYIVMDRQAYARAQGSFIAIHRLEPTLKSGYLKRPKEVIRKMRYPVRRSPQ